MAARTPVDHANLSAKIAEVVGTLNSIKADIPKAVAPGTNRRHLRDLVETEVNYAVTSVTLLGRYVDEAGKEAEALAKATAKVAGKANGKKESATAKKPGDKAEVKATPAAKKNGGTTKPAAAKPATPAVKKNGNGSATKTGNGNGTTTPAAPVVTSDTPAADKA